MSSSEPVQQNDPTTGGATATLESASSKAAHMTRENTGYSSTGSGTGQYTMGRKIIAEDPEWNLSPVEKLSDICLSVIVHNFERKPLLDGLPQKYRSKVIKHVRVDLPLELAAKLIPDEEYWQRASLAQWNICNVSKHGGSWKQLYFENEVKRAVENFVPGKSSEFDLVKTLAVAKDFVKILHIDQLFPAYHEAYLATDPKPDHMDTEMIVKSLGMLEELSIYYGVKNCGMDFSWIYFGMTLNDTQKLQNVIKSKCQLRKLVVRQSDIDDLKTKILSAGLAENTSIEHLDLSHNKIGDAGATALAKVLAKKTPLSVLKLSNNQIEKTGLTAISKALESNDQIKCLDLSLNPLCDEGVIPLFGILGGNKSLEELNISSTWLTTNIIRDFCSMIQKNRGLKQVDLSSNTFAENDGKILIDSLRDNSVLERIDLRFTGLDVTQLNAIQYIYESRKSTSLIEQQQKRILDMHQSDLEQKQQQQQQQLLKQQQQQQQNEDETHQNPLNVTETTQQSNGENTDDYGLDGEMEDEPGLQENDQVENKSLGKSVSAIHLQEENHQATMIPAN